MIDRDVGKFHNEAKLIRMLDRVELLDKLPCRRDHLLIWRRRETKKMAEDEDGEGGVTKSERAATE